MFHIFKEEYHGRKNRNYEGKDEKKIKKFIKESYIRKLIKSMEFI